MAKNRQARNQAALRERRKVAGLIQRTIWIKREDLDRVKAIEKEALESIEPITPRTETRE